MRIAMRGILTVMFAAAFGGAAAAQSLSPMHKSGVTPSDIKGFRLTIGNPYAERMQFVLVPMEPGFTTRATDASVSPPEMVLAPGYARQAILMFRIPPTSKERTIGLCISPKHVDGPVLPRVCGTYTGSVIAGNGR